MCVFLDYTKKCPTHTPKPDLVHFSHVCIFGETNQKLLPYPCTRAFFSFRCLKLAVFHFFFSFQCTFRIFAFVLFLSVKLAIFHFFLILVYISYFRICLISEFHFSVHFAFVSFLSVKLANFPFFLILVYVSHFHIFLISEFETREFSFFSHFRVRFAFLYFVFRTLCLHSIFQYNVHFILFQGMHRFLALV